MVLNQTERSAQSGALLVSVWWFYFKSYLVIYTGPFDQSPVPFVEEGLRIAATTGLGTEATPFLLVQAALGAIDRGDLEKASTFLKRMEGILVDLPPVCHAQYHVAAGLYYLRINEFPRALLHTKEMVRLCREIYFPFFEAAIHLDAAFILMQAGELDRASDELSAYRALPDTTSMILEYSCLVAEAALAPKLGAPDALAFLQEALALGRRKGFISPLFSWIPSLMSRLCSAALKAGIEVDQVRHIIRSRALVPGEPAIDVDAWPWPVKVHTLGGFEIRINDEPLIFTGKVQKRPLDLLKLLIARGGKEVPQDWIEYALWPEAEGDAAADAFKTTLLRLRKLLRIEGVIEVSGGKLSLSETTVWVDTKALEHLAEGVSRLWQNRRVEPVLEEAQEAALRLAALYKGDFLKNDDEAWIHPYSDRLRRTCLRTVRRLTDIFVDSHREDLAAALHEQAVDAGFLPEEVNSSRTARVVR